MLQHIALVELGSCWAIWLLVLVWPRRRAPKQEDDAGISAARWGILLNLLGFAFVLALVRPPDFEKTQSAYLTSMILAPLSVLMALTSKIYLAKRWRDEDKHSEYFNLVRTGPFGIVRHPMYTASLGMLLATGAAWTSTPMLFAGIFFFVAGLELRLFAADRALANRFQEEFAEYQSRVRAYIPLIR